MFIPDCLGLVCSRPCVNKHNFSQLYISVYTLEVAEFASSYVRHIITCSDVYVFVADTIQSFSTGISLSAAVCISANFSLVEHRSFKPTTSVVVVQRCSSNCCRISARNHQRISRHTRHDVRTRVSNSNVVNHRRNYWGMMRVVSLVFGVSYKTK